MKYILDQSYREWLGLDIFGMVPHQGHSRWLWLYLDLEVCKYFQIKCFFVSLLRRWDKSELFSFLGIGSKQGGGTDIN